MGTRLLRSPKGLRTVACIIALAGVLPLSTAAQNVTVAGDSGVGSVWWTELVSANPERARDFYASVIGWTPKVVAAEDTSRPPQPDEDEYTLLEQSGFHQAGIEQHDADDPEAPRPGWLTYIQVKNIDEAVATAISKGGKVLRAPSDVNRVGRLAIIQDPDGHPLGLVTPLPGAGH